MLEFGWAETQEEKDACYRLRYLTYTVEYGDDRHAEHDSQRFIDPVDSTNCFLAYAKVDGEIVGTNRLVVRHLGPFAEPDETYNFPALAEKLEVSPDALIKAIGASERTAIHPQHRGTGLFLQLQEMIYERARAEGCHWLVGLVKYGNERGRKAVEKQGWEQYGFSQTSGPYDFLNIYRGI